MRKETLKTACDIIIKQLTKNNWGTELSPVAGTKNFLITDYRAFGLIIGLLKYQLKLESQDDQIFLRGQSNNWSLCSSLHRYYKVDRMNERFQNDGSVKEINRMRERLVDEWYNNALEILYAQRFDFKGTPSEQEAIAQHYGLTTPYIDVVDHLQTALWFAYDCKNLDYPPKAVGYIYIISVSEADADILDLRKKPSDFLRPHIQQALCFRMKRKTEYGKVSSKYHIMTLCVPRELLRLWSNYDNIGRSYMYPPQEFDDGQNFWAKVKNELEKKELWTNPELWVEHQIPEKWRIYYHEQTNI